MSSAVEPRSLKEYIRRRVSLVPELESYLSEDSDAEFVAMSPESEKQSPVETTQSPEEKKVPNLVDAQPFVIIKVNGVSYGVHKNFICHYSPFFHAAFNSTFAEGQSQEMTLSDTSPKLFGMLVHWIYTQTVVNEFSSPLTHSSLVDMWILADRFIAPGLQNCVLRLLLPLHTSMLEKAVLGPEIPRAIYANTVPGSRLRKYLVALVVSIAHETLGDSVEYPTEFLVDVANRYCKILKESRALIKNSYWVNEPLPGFLLSDFLAPETDVRIRK